MKFIDLNELNLEVIEEMYENSVIEQPQITDCGCTYEGSCYNSSVPYCTVKEDGTDSGYCTYLCRTQCNSSVGKWDNNYYPSWSYGWGCRRK